MRYRFYLFFVLRVTTVVQELLHQQVAHVVPMAHRWDSKQLVNVLSAQQVLTVLRLDRHLLMVSVTQDSIVSQEQQYQILQMVSLEMYALLGVFVNTVRSEFKTAHPVLTTLIRRVRLNKTALHA